MDTPNDFLKTSFSKNNDASSLVEEEEEVVVVGSIDVGMSYLLIFSEILWWKRSGYQPIDQQIDGRTDGPTDRAPYRDAWNILIQVVIAFHTLWESQTTFKTRVIWLLSYGSYKLIV